MLLKDPKIFLSVFDPTVLSFKFKESRWTYLPTKFESDILARIILDFGMIGNYQNRRNRNPNLSVVFNESYQSRDGTLPFIRDWFFPVYEYEASRKNMKGRYWTNTKEAQPNEYDTIGYIKMRGNDFSFISEPRKPFVKKTAAA